MTKFFLFSLIAFATLTASAKDPCLTKDEAELARLTNEYRQRHSLPEIAVSSALSKVARAHVIDLEKNSPTSDDCNLHSWSNQGPWTSCCYTDDHAQAQCMWNKPKEISNFDTFGFEIASMGGQDPEDILSIFKGSSPHRAVILNEDNWKNVNFKSMGVGIFGSYAVIWFGQAEDKLSPGVCE